MANNESAPHNEIWEQVVLETRQKSDEEIVNYVEVAIEDRRAAGKEPPSIGLIYTREPVSEEEAKRAAYRCLYAVFRIAEEKGVL